MPSRLVVVRGMRRVLTEHQKLWTWPFAGKPTKDLAVGDSKRQPYGIATLLIGPRRVAVLARCHGGLRPAC